VKPARVVFVLWLALACVADSRSERASALRRISFGMTATEVTASLGPPRAREQVTFSPDDGILFWFYGEHEAADAEHAFDHDQRDLPPIGFHLGRVAGTTWTYYNDCVARSRGRFPLPPSP
jgi:hypothetical protein